MAAGALPKISLGPLTVDAVCLGTMTWGRQASKEEAWRQLDEAVLRRGVSFIDTAEVFVCWLSAAAVSRSDGID